MYPLLGPIFKISCSFWEEMTKIIGLHTHLLGWHPPLGNSGSATGNYNLAVTLLNQHFFQF